MRIRGWELALLEEVERHQALPFSWEESNCVYFPMDCVKAMTGEDPWYDERGCTSEKDFKRRMAKHKFKTVGDIFAARFPEIHLAEMGRGDLGVVEEVKGITPGVVCLGAMLIGKTSDGTIFVPRSRTLRAFKVN